MIDWVLFIFSSLRNQLHMEECLYCKVVFCLNKLKNLETWLTPYCKVDEIYCRWCLYLTCLYLISTIVPRNSFSFCVCWNEIERKKDGKTHFRFTYKNTFTCKNLKLTLHNIFIYSSFSWTSTMVGYERNHLRKFDLELYVYLSSFFY